MTLDEQSRLSNYRSMATMNQGQAIDYHVLLTKLDEEVMKVVEPEVIVVGEAPKHKKKKV